MTDAQRFGRAAVAEHLQVVERDPSPQPQQQLASGSAHGGVALGVTRLDDDGTLVEADQPLALDIGGVEVHGAAVAGGAVGAERRHEHGEQLVDPVDAERRVDRLDRPSDGLLGVDAVHRRLLGHPPWPEAGAAVGR